MTWTPPTYDDFIARYPQFVDYDQALVQLILDDSNMRIGEGNWADHDKTPASLALTAHMLALTPKAYPIDDGSGGGGGVPGSGESTKVVKSRTVGDVKEEYETGTSKQDIFAGSSSGSAPIDKFGTLADFFLTPYGRYYMYLMKLNFPGVAVVYR